MDRKIIVTGDNSKTLLIPKLDETYHSTHGALNEARHVFIQNGMESFDTESLSIFELGFGSGLNLLVTLEFLELKKTSVFYTSIEKYPLSYETVEQLEYDQLVDPRLKPAFEKAHLSPWNEKIRINKQLELLKQEGDITAVSIPTASFDLVFYDAFGPRVQPDLWSEKVLQKMFDGLKINGRLVTYCAQGQFKRNLKAVGFDVLNVPGPPGKREMTIGIKTR